MTGFVSYRNQSIDLLYKSMDWFLETSVMKELKSEAIALGLFCHEDLSKDPRLRWKIKIFINMWWKFQAYNVEIISSDFLDNTGNDRIVR